VAVASTGPYASLQIAPDRQQHQHSTTLFFTGRMPFLPPNQQRQSTEGITAEDMEKSQHTDFNKDTTDEGASVACSNIRL